MRHQFDRSGTIFFGSDAKNNTIQTQRRTTSLYKNSPVSFYAIGSVDMLHLTAPGVEKKNDHVIANVPIPINEPSADRIGINAPAVRRAAVILVYSAEQISLASNPEDREPRNERAVGNV